MSSRIHFVFLLLSSLCLLCGCDQMKNIFPAASPSKPSVSSTQESGAVVSGTPLVKINNEVVVTLENFDEKIKGLKELSPEIKIDTIDAKKAFLNELVTQELISHEARSRGIDRQKDVKVAVDEFKKTVMARQLLLDETKGIAVEPSEVESFYETYKKQLAQPEQISVREIVVSSDAAAKEILIALLQGGDFAAIAKERSVASSASRGGEVGVVKREEKFDKYMEVISTLEPGQVSQIFKGPDNSSYIVRVEEKKGGAIPLLTDKLPDSDVTIYDQIKNLLLQQKQAQRIQDLTDKLRKEAKIDIKEDLLR